MKHIRTTDVAEHIGQRVVIHGWLHAFRALSAVSFAVVRDGYGLVQAVAEPGGALDVLADVGHESVVRIEGRVVASDQANAGIELHEPAAEVLVAVDEPLPVVLGKRELNAQLHTLLDHAVVANRHPRRRAVFRVSAAAMAGFRDGLGGLGFTEIQSPKIVASSTESGANVFQLDYFGRPAFLAQSPQFYKQIMVGVFERVFEVGPVFRAEPHATIRHVNEYVSLDAEMGFIADHRDVMSVLRQALASIFAAISERCPEELALVGAAVPVVPAEIPALDFVAAREWLGAADPLAEPDLSPEDERRLGVFAQETWGSDFLFVTGYPMVKRPFYTHPDPARPELSNSFDLLFRGTELVTGGQRRHRYADLEAALRAAGHPLEPLTTYLEAFRYGMPPHGGFAIGLERLVAQLLGLDNLRLATLFPRDLQRLAP